MTTTRRDDRTSSYLYDANGNLLIQRDPGATTLYLTAAPRNCTSTPTTGTVTGKRYYDEPDGTAIVRSSTGAIDYELANPQGTNTETSTPRRWRSPAATTTPTATRAAPCLRVGRQPAAS